MSPEGRIPLINITPVVPRGGGDADPVECPQAPKGGTPPLRSSPSGRWLRSRGRICSAASGYSSRSTDVSCCTLRRPRAIRSGASPRKPWPPSPQALTRCGFVPDDECPLVLIPPRKTQFVVGKVRGRKKHAAGAAFADGRRIHTRSVDENEHAPNVIRRPRGRRGWALWQSRFASLTFSPVGPALSGFVRRRHHW